MTEVLGITFKRGKDKSLPQKTYYFQIYKFVLTLFLANKSYPLTIVFTAFKYNLVFMPWRIFLLKKNYFS